MIPQADPKNLMDAISDWKGCHPGKTEADLASKLGSKGRIYLIYSQKSGWKFEHLNFFQRIWRYLFGHIAFSDFIKMPKAKDLLTQNMDLNKLGVVPKIQNIASKSLAKAGDENTISSVATLLNQAIETKAEQFLSGLEKQAENSSFSFLSIVSADTAASSNENEDLVQVKINLAEPALSSFEDAAILFEQKKAIVSALTRLKEIQWLLIYKNPLPSETDDTSSRLLEKTIRLDAQFQQHISQIDGFINTNKSTIKNLLQQEEESIKKGGDTEKSGGAILPQCQKKSTLESIKHALAQTESGASIAKAAAFKGISNGGNTCYIASAVQMLRAFAPLNELLSKPLTRHPAQSGADGKVAAPQETARNFINRQNLQTTLRNLLTEIDKGNTLGNHQAILAFRWALFHSSFNTGQFPLLRGDGGSGEGDQLDAVDVIGTVLQVLDYSFAPFRIRSFKNPADNQDVNREMPSIAGYPMLKLELLKSDNGITFAKKCENAFHQKNIDNRQYEIETSPYQDSKGNTRQREVQDADGNPVYKKDASGNPIPKGTFEWRPLSGNNQPQFYDENFIVKGNAPEFLPVHLSRFSATGQKVTAKVSFGKSLDDPIDLNHLFPEDKNKDALYQVVGFNVHHGGGLAGGHYTAYRLDSDGEWRHYDDDDVSVLTKNQAFKASQQACSLILKKVAKS